MFGHFTTLCMKGLISLCFLTFSIVFPKTALFINLKHFFFKIIFCFLSSIFVYEHALWTFLKSNLWFNAYLKFLMCITYSVLLCKLATSFSTFSIFILSGKNGKSLWSSCNFSRYWTSTSEKYPSSLLSL